MASGESIVLVVPIRRHLTDPGGVDLAVYNDMPDVYALRPKLPGHALRQRPQPELARSQRRFFI